MLLKYIFSHSMHTKQVYMNTHKLLVENNQASSGRMQKMHIKAQSEDFQIVGLIFKTPVFSSLHMEMVVATKSRCFWNFLRYIFLNTKDL